MLRNPRGSAPGQRVEAGGTPGRAPAGPPFRDVADVRGAGRAAPRRDGRGPRAADPHPEDRLDVGERRRAGGGARLQDVHQPAHDDPRRARARSSCTSPPKATPPRRPRSASRRWPRGSGPRCPGASTARTAASCPRWWPRCSWSAGLPSPSPSPAPAALLAARLTEVPGASRFLDRAYVPYANAAKVECSGVDPGLLERAGAVSEEVAAAMAAGARARRGPTSAVAITGIAGPAGGTPEKPVGLVYIALAAPPARASAAASFPGSAAGAGPGHPGRARDGAARAPGAGRAVSEQGRKAAIRAFVALELRRRCVPRWPRDRRA